MIRGNHRDMEGTVLRVLKDPERLERWQTSYLPVFGIWAAAVVIVLTWEFTPFMMLILLAGLTMAIGRYVR